MTFDLVVGDAGPSLQLDTKSIMSESDRIQQLATWEGTSETFPESIANPVFHAIIEGDSDDLRICNRKSPGEARPIQFTDKGGQVFWNLTQPN